jgi:hypothetical protein
VGEPEADSRLARPARPGHRGRRRRAGPVPDRVLSTWVLLAE